MSNELVPYADMQRIENHERYLISADGQVWDTKRQRFQPQYLRGRYLSVCLAGGPKGKLHTVSRLVAAAFVPNPDGLPQVNHKNGIKTDNRAANLEWCSVSHNIRHAFETGLRSHTEKMRASSRKAVRKAHQATRHYTRTDVARIKRLYSQGISQREIAAMFYANQSQISRIITAKSYRQYNV